MPTPQPGIFAPTQRHQYALEFRLLADCDNATVAVAIAAIDTEFRTHARGATHVVALGPDLCRMLGVVSSPECRSFQAIDGTQGKSAPALQNDLLLWMQGPSPDVLLDLAIAASKALTSVMRLAIEVPGFVYHDSRDLTGFIDGSANPTGDLMRETALTANGQAHVLSQKWVHDLAGFNALDVAEQERVIGRTKQDSIELEGDAMPENSHVARTDVAVDGETQRIYRRSFPFGTLASPGAGMMPTLVITLMMLFGLALVATAGSSPRFTEIEWGDFPHALRVIGVAAVAVALYTVLGFILTMSLMLFGLIFGVERRSFVRAAAMSIGVTVFAYLLFGSLLKSPLPQGIMPF